MKEDKIVLFKSSDGEVSLPVSLGADTVWLTQVQMAQLFGKDQSVISRHVRNAIADGEIDETMYAKIWSRAGEGEGRLKPPPPMDTAGGSSSKTSASADGGAGDDSPVLISTFTSAQEREALRRALAKGKRVIQVVPQGLPTEGEMSPEQPMGSRLNKKVATWCNEYVLRHAIEIWVGDLSSNGMLSAMSKGLCRDEDFHRSRRPWPSDVRRSRKLKK